MIALVQVSGIAAVAMIALTWHQPGALMSAALMIEKLAQRAVRRMRIRAFAKRDAIESYRRSYAWHRNNAV